MSPALSPEPSAVSPLGRDPALREERSGGVRLHHPSTQLPANQEGRAVGEVLGEQLSLLGFSAYAQTGLEPFNPEAEDLEKFLSEGREGEMTYLAEPYGTGLARRDPRSLWEDARAALVVTLPYSPPKVSLRTGRNGEPCSGQIAAYAGGSDYHHVIKERLLLAADILADLLGHAVLARPVVDTAPLLERQLLRRAGLAFLGKNTLAITPGAGSYFHIGTLLLEKPVADFHTKRTATNGCGTCSACLVACPTGALDGAHRIDARRCISYLTIEHRGPLPRDLRPLMGTWLFGCDACQSSCPYNQSKSVPGGDAALEQQAAWESPALAEVLWLTSNQYKKRVKGTAMRRASRAQLARNAAVALGNTRSSIAVEPLERAVWEHPYDAVRTHAAWALGELALSSVEPARVALDRLTEPSEATAQLPEVVAEELRFALERLSLVQPVA